MFVIPKKDFSIVDPERRDVLPPEGRNVGSDNSIYWDRRIADGDVTRVADDKIAGAQQALERADADRAAATARAAEPEKAQDAPAPVPSKGGPAQAQK